MIEKIAVRHFRHEMDALAPTSGMTCDQRLSSSCFHSGYLGSMVTKIPRGSTAEDQRHCLIEGRVEFERHLRAGVPHEHSLAGENDHGTGRQALLGSFEADVEAAGGG